MAKKTMRKTARSRKRSHVVSASLVGAMLVVGAGLAALDRSSRPTAPESVTLPALMAAAVEAPKIDAIFRTNVPIQKGRWQAIVIHHSASPFATSESLSSATGGRQTAFQFVIGNGNGMGDGDLHVGSSWMDQTAGRHSSGKFGPWLNQNAIAICLVGDGNRKPFSGEQLDQLVRLTNTLAKEFGIDRQKIYLPSDLDPSSKNPGSNFPAAQFRAQLKDYGTGAVHGQPRNR